ncbi:MAG: hypothetical protein Q4B73_00885 [Lachnospiraceae bacterium]|nr:hypothetical protein [Lachnospiraceae bacterium]
MIFKEKREDNGWVIVDYAATWNYGYDFMLDAAQVLIDTDFKDKVQYVDVAADVGGDRRDLTKSAAACGNDLRKCPAIARENASLAIAGPSDTMACAFKLIFFNQTRVVRLISPMVDYFSENGDHVFDNYLNSVEIQAYCRAAERRVRENG